MEPNPAPPPVGMRSGIGSAGGGLGSRGGDPGSGGGVGNSGPGDYAHRSYGSFGDYNYGPPSGWSESYSDWYGRDTPQTGRTDDYAISDGMGPFGESASLVLYLFSIPFGAFDY
ncbi:unnamed protein product [Protopolystoma xenopodis]|uniref:Uncharacterized protein n=1 Tax=Protopolystoma xenopodis TaxID=117903 RepID=A0A448X5H7_9PLAT|nr:unnamed protein product [Protopolystoma xenopodis]